MKTSWKIARRTINDFFADDAMTLAGALAFYTALSMAPLLILVIALAGFLWQDVQVRDQVVNQAGSLIGSQGGEMVKTVIDESGKQQMHGIGAVIGIVTLLFGATSVFAQLQYSLNRIFNVEARPGQGVWEFIRKRLLSLGMILAVAFLLLVSLVVSSALDFATGSSRVDLPGGDAGWAVVNILISVVVFAVIFLGIFKYLPDVKLPFRDALIGALATAVMFALGKHLLAWYLSQGSTSSAYGAAGSLLVVLLWVYYSSLILFIGAEFTQAYASEMNHRIEPEAHAQWMEGAKRDPKKGQVGRPADQQHPPRGQIRPT